jgi:DNA polymerase-3 subunit alpha
MRMIRDGGFVQLAEIDEDTVGEQIEVIALIASIRRLTTKSNRTMAVCEFEDQSGAIEGVLFPDVYEAAADLLLDDAVVRIAARVDNRNDRIQLIVTNVTRMSTEKPIPVRIREVHLHLTASPDLDGDIRLMHQIRELFDEFQGDDRVVLHVSSGQGRTELIAGLGVDWCTDVEAALKELVGLESFHVEEREEFRQPDAQRLSA